MVFPAKAAAADATPAAPDPRRAQAMALHVTAVLQAMAEKREREGQPAGISSRSIAVKAGLDSAQADAVGRVAARMSARVTPLDERAKAIIQAAHERYPGGRLPAGVLPPPPPPELHELQLQRNALVEQALQELEGELGPAAMTKLSNCVGQSMTTFNARKRIVPTPSQIGPPRPPVQPSSPLREGAK
jgi:hypothetical protein